MNEYVPPAPPAVTSPPKTCGLATASMVLGILGLMCLLPIVSPILALIFGIIALSQISKSGGKVKGRWQAIAGLATGVVGLLLQVAMIVPAVHGAREKARLAQCLNNVKQIGVAIGMYADKHDGNIPRTFDDLRPYATNLDKLLVCPSAEDRRHPSYQILLGGGKWQGDNPDAIVVTESTNDHRFGYHVLLDDGHVEFRSNGRDPFKPD